MKSTIKPTQKRILDSNSIVLKIRTNDNPIDPNSPPDGLAFGVTTISFAGYPSELEGNSGMIIALTWYYGEDIAYGMQIFMSFGSNKIATRNHPYGTDKSWSEWRII